MGCATSYKTSLSAPPSEFKVWNLEEEVPGYMNPEKRLPSAVSQYKINGTCGGLPRVELKTAPGFCLGLVDSGEGLEMPRTALALNQNQIVLTEMTSWQAGVGRIYLLTWNGHSYDRKTLLDSAHFADKQKIKILDRPYLVSRGPDGKIYVGAAGSIGRFDPLAANVAASVEIVIDGLPNEGLHPLKSFTFDAKIKKIYVNVGASTNDCQKQGFQGAHAKFCVEAESKTAGVAQIRAYQQLPNGKFDPNFEVFAKGLRNSMALLWDEDLQLLLQAENGRDAINKFNAQLTNDNFPHEEFNVVKKAGHYGWPYCFDNNRPNPEWKYMNCSGYQPPYLLLPPHAAPLSLLKYKGNMFPASYKNRYIMSFHGYAAAGHRIVTFARDQKGLPMGNPLSIVYGWDANGAQQVGTPVGLSEMPDGSLLIVEDKSKKVLRLFYDPKEGDGSPVKEDMSATPAPEPDAANNAAAMQAKLQEKLREKNPPLFSLFQDKVIDKQCAACHGGAGSPGIQFLAYDDVGNAKRIKENDKAHEMLMRISADPKWPMMPPQGMDSPDEQREAVRLLKAWIDAGQPNP